MPRASQATAGIRPTRGKTVGRALIRSYLHDYENRENPDYKPLYTQPQFNRMVAGLRSETEHHIYAQYVSLYNGLVEEFARAHGYYQQAQNALGRLLAYLSDANRAIDADILLSGFPPSEATIALRALFMGLPELDRSEPAQQDIIGMHQTLLAPALRWLRAYNALVKRLAVAYALPGLSLLLMEEDNLREQAEAYNAELEPLMSRCEGTPEGLLAARLFVPIAWPVVDETAGAEVFALASEIGSYETTTVQRLVLSLMEVTR
ncbi:hypothetical protein LJC74_08750 [Eubacteriales bacterium OttesenSCG-928-A19]|nr:hypothetical protein [Eubacteriales bacterium OttesenSCG-928-A19]